jgi:cell division protein FtsQ
MELSLPLPRRGAPRGRRGSRRPGGAVGERAWLVVDRLRGNRLALRATLATLAAVPLLGGGWLWLRDSSLVSVRHVHIVGVHGVEALEIRQALDNAAMRMTTMDFDVGALRSAVSSFAIVGALHVATGFPHSVRIAVVERPPVAALLSAGQRTAVAADGTVLGPAFLSSSLPLVSGSVEPAVGARVGDPAARAAVAVLGAAPGRLAAFVTRVYSGPEGLTVAMRNGLLAYFGDATRPHAKWLSLARVLVSPSAAGALYVDVRLPERPAAGFSSTHATATSATSTPLEAGSSEPTAAALAASLSKAAGGSAGSAAGSSASGEESEAAGRGEAASGSSTAAGGGEGEASSGSGVTSAPNGGESSATVAGGAGATAQSTAGEASAGSTGGASSAPVPGG